MEMSFHNGTLNRERAEQIIADSDLPILYTFGFEYRDPTTHCVPITKEEAYEIIRTESLLDIDFTDDYIYLNGYSENDMW